MFGSEKPDMKSAMATKTMIIKILMVMIIKGGNAGDTNDVFDPCSDTKIQRYDGFTFGLAFSNKDSFFFEQTQLSPCDNRLALSSKTPAPQLAVFRLKVDEISLLTVNGTFSGLVQSGMYMVAFAGRKYAARSAPVFVADNTNFITSFTLVFEFQEGTLQNLFWKKLGCDSCPENSMCVNNEDCAASTSKCMSNDRSVNCNVNIQLTFSGTDKSDNVLNSWYETKNLRRYSLYSLYSNIHDPDHGQFSSIF